jgi:hypothetical protein
MLDIVKKSLACNGNSSGAINARGIPHRGWTAEQRVAAAADAVLGTTHVVPSIGQAATQFGVSPYSVRQELKARAEAPRRIQDEAEWVNEQADLLVEVWNFASPTAREAAVRVIGVGNVWNVVAPIVT